MRRTPGLVLIALVIACWAAPTAAAVELPTVDQVTTAVTSQVPEGPAKPLADTVESVAAKVEAAAPAIPSAPAPPAVPAAPALPEAPALAKVPADDGQARPQAAPQRPSARINAARVEPSPLRGERLRSTIAAPAAKSFESRPTAAVAPSDGRTAGTAHGSAPPRAVSPSPQEERPGGPDQPGPALGAAAASATTAMFFFGGLGLLAGGILLAGPQLSRRLVTRPASWRPVGLVLLLERPG